MATSSNKAEELAAAAMEQLPQTRLTFVDQSCAGDDGLKARVHELLRRLENPPDILAMPAGGADPPGHGGITRPQSGLAEAPGSSIGNYRILQLIGEGGFGNVYMAEQERPIRRRVALKIIKLGMDTNQVIARFEVERQALAMMDHPNIARVLDAGATETGRPYFVMELVRGIPITSYCDGERLSTKQRLGLFILVCRAVQHAHQKGIIHRDIKPSNVMVTISDGIAIPKIIDFGIAKATNALLTERTYFTEYRQLIGTPEYMSPEQAEASGIDIDTRSDIYSLGVLLYELLTGTTPLDPKSLRQLSYGEIQRLIREVDPPPPSTRLGTLGQSLSTVATQRRTEPRRLGQMLRGELDWIVMKCLEKDRTRRYEAAANLANDIQRHLDNERVFARPATTAYRVQKFISRHIKGVAVTAAIVLLFFVLLIGLAIATYRAIAAQKSEVHHREVAQKALDGERAAKSLAEQNLIKGLILAGDRFANVGNVVEARDFYRRAWDTARANGVSELPAVIALLSGGGEMPLMGSFGERGGVGGFNGHSKNVTAVVLRKDGRTAVTSCEDTTLRVWDLPTGRELLPPLEGHSAGVAMLALSSDDRTLLSASHNGEIWLWDLDTHQRTYRLSDEPIDVWAVAISPNGQFAVAGSVDGRIRRWDIRQRAQLPDITQAHDGPVGNLAFSPDGSKVLSGGRDSLVKLWDLASGNLEKKLEGHTYHVNSVAFGPDGRTAISGGFDFKVIYWNIDTSERQYFHGHSDWVWRVAISRDGKLAVSGGRDETFRRWDVRTGTQIGTFTGQFGEAMGVAISDDGTVAVASGLGSVLRVWDCRPDAGIGPTDFPDPLTSLAVSKEHMILLGSAGGRLILWDGAAGRKLQEFAGHPGGVRDAVISSDEKTVLSAGDDGAVTHWDIATAKPKIQLRGHQGAVNCVAFVKDEMAISGGADSSIRVWALKKSQPERLLSGHTAPVTGISVAADGQRALSASKDGTARLWNLASGSEIRPLAHSRLIAAALSPDGKIAVSLGDDGSLKVWDAATGQMTRDMTDSAPSPSRLALSPDARIAWVVASDGSLGAWDIVGRTKLGTIKAHKDAARCIAVAADGSCVVSSGDDKMLKLWDLSRPASYRDFESRINRARKALESDPQDAAALATFGEWYALRGMDQWAVDLLERARSGGAKVKSITLARCYWRLSESNRAHAASAAREFTRAIESKEAPEQYLRLCLDAVERTAAQPR